jgi:phenylacetate-coenzyme A ligase PaaK-like adenylate-forming protein
LVFGFTYLVWSRVLPELRRRDVPLGLRRAALFHGGGWKKLREQQVSKEAFNRSVADGLGCSPNHVYDFYGMVEQVGSIFIDCEEGHKHEPNFATVIIRDPLTMEMVPVGGEGLIEVISLLPSSYPGQVVLTEDCGQLVAIDDCPCGRLGIAFDFTSRVQHVELRGCGDTLAAGGR